MYFFNGKTIEVENIQIIKVDQMIVFYNAMWQETLPRQNHFVNSYSFSEGLCLLILGERESIFYLERIFIYYSTILLLSTCQVVCVDSYTIIYGITHSPYIILIEKWVGYLFMSYIPRKVSREVLCVVYRKVSRGRFSNTIWVLESLKIFCV